MPETQVEEEKKERERDAGMDPSCPSYPAQDEDAAPVVSSLCVITGYCCY